MKPADLSAHAEYPEHLRTFPRQRQDWREVELVQTRPAINPWLFDLSCGVGLIVFMVAAFAGINLLLAWIETL